MGEGEELSVAPGAEEEGRGVKSGEGTAQGFYMSLLRYLLPN